jgi:hypothetical protein
LFSGRIAKPHWGEKKACKNRKRGDSNKQCCFGLCRKCCIVSYQKCGVSDHDPKAHRAKPYLETLAHLTASNTEINTSEDSSSATAAADFEHVKAMLETAISERRSVFISYLAEKKPTAEEGGKKRCKKKGEQPVLVDTYRKIMPKSFDEGKREPGLKVIADCGLRDGEQHNFFFHKITRIEDHDWKGTWRSHTTGMYLRSLLSFYVYLHYLCRYSSYKCLDSFAATACDNRRISHVTESRAILGQIQRTRIQRTRFAQVPGCQCTQGNECSPRPPGQTLGEAVGD